MNEVVVICIVHASVVIEDSSAYFQVTEADAPCKSSKVVNSNVIPPEEIEDFFGFRVCDVEYLWFLDPGVVRSVGDGSGVVGRIEFPKAEIAHMIRSNKFISNYSINSHHNLLKQIDEEF